MICSGRNTFIWTCRLPTAAARLRSARHSPRTAPQLIFTVGEDSLTAAAQTITDLPVVASNVMDFERILHIITPQGEDWDGTTGRNITGVSNLTSIPQQTSMLIETTKDLRAVGILYCTEDQNAVFQNEMLETYLDEAGIPWKEYAIPSTSAADISSGGENPAT